MGWVWKKLDMEAYLWFLKQELKWHKITLFSTTQPQYHRKTPGVQLKVGK